MTNTQDSQVATAFGFAITLGLPLNAVALWILLHRHSLSSPNVVFMVNLVISDLVLAISLPLRIYYYATGMWGMGHMACIFSMMLFRNNIRSSSIFITYISVDRLLAVVFPLKSRHLRTSSNAWRAAAITWLFLLIMNTPESVYLIRVLREFEEEENKSVCFELGNKTNESTPIRLFQPVLVFNLLAVNVVCTALVSWTLFTHLSDFAKVNKKVNVMVIFVVNLLMFVVFFVPLSVFPVGPKILRENMKTVLALGSINCCVDPLLYYFSLDGFWRRKETASTHVSENSRQVQAALNTG